MTDLNTTERLAFIAETQLKPSGAVRVLKGFGEATIFIVTLYLLIASIYMIGG